MQLNRFFYPNGAARPELPAVFQSLIPLIKGCLYEHFYTTSYQRVNIAKLANLLNKQLTEQGEKLTLKELASLSCYIIGSFQNATSSDLFSQERLQQGAILFKQLLKKGLL